MTTPAVLTTGSAAATTDPNLDAIRLLSAQLDANNVEFDKMDRYYSGDQPLTYMAPEVAAQLGGRLGRLVINWPEVVVDSVARRLNVEGFRMGLGGEADAELWRIYTANQLDEETPLGIIDALVHGVVFLLVWGNDDDPSTPRMTFESAHQMAVDYEPGGTRVRSALKRWVDGNTAFATLYTADYVYRYSAAVSAFGVTVDPAYRLAEVIPNPVGEVPVVPMVNRGRLGNRAGRSELRSVAPLADAINKVVSDMMVTSEFYVTPRRYVTGMAVPAGVERERFQAEMREFWENAPKSKFLVAGEGASFGQFPEATLDGFVKAANMLTAALAAIGGLPPDDLGLNTTNPASAEARRAAETTLILRAKEKWRPYGGALTRAMRLALAFRDRVRVRDLDPVFDLMKVAWADPATPAIAQAMDAAVKGVEAGIYDVEAAQEQVGMSPVERAAVKARAQEAAALAATATVRAQVDFANELESSQGLTKNAALAAAGLLRAADLNSAEAPPTPQ